MKFYFVIDKKKLKFLASQLEKQELIDSFCVEISVLKSILDYVNQNLNKL